jgi:hypothetical protein
MVLQMPKPLPLQPGTWQYDKHQDQERQLAERVAAFEAEEERKRKAREAAAERKRQEWLANAPARARAQVELAELERRIEVHEAEQERLLDRARELEDVANR